MNQEEFSPLAHLQFVLNSVQKWKDKEDNLYMITVTSFHEHDHEHRPIYYLDYPLKESIEQENADGVVVSVECFSDGYPSPYSAVVEDQWTVCRKHIDLQFVRQDGNDVVMNCVIFEAKLPGKVLGFKGSISPEQVQQTIDELKDR